jgi:hypothetical protein
MLCTMADTKAETVKFKFWQGLEHYKRNREKGGQMGKEWNKLSYYYYSKPVLGNRNRNCYCKV